MSSYAAMDRHFPTTLTARLGPVNAEAIVVGDGGQYGDVSLGRYSTVIKPVSIPTSAPVNRQPFVYTVAAGEDLSAIASKFHVSVAEIRWSNTNLMSTDSVATGNQIVVPPVHGIVVTTKATDTIDSLASKYQVDSQTIIDYNRLRTADVADAKRLLEAAMAFSSHDEIERYVLDEMKKRFPQLISDAGRAAGERGL